MNSSKPEIDYRARRQVVSDSMVACPSIEAESKFLGLLGSTIDDWPPEDWGWLSWIRTRPASQLVMGQAGGGSCFVFSPSDHVGYWALYHDGMRGQGVLSSGDVTALEEIQQAKGIRAS